jgi:hypothetical protein
MFAGAVKGDVFTELGGAMDRREEHSEVPGPDRREGIGCPRARFRWTWPGRDIGARAARANQGRGAGTVNFRPIAGRGQAQHEQGCWRRGIVNVNLDAVVRMIGGRAQMSRDCRGSLLAHSALRCLAVTF